MSAWIVSKAHIDCLVQSLAMEGIISFADANNIGRELWRENHRSINYRYSERGRAPKYTFTGIEAPLDPGIVLKQTRCYWYQTCERPDFERSVSARLVEQLETALLGRLGYADMTDFREHDPRWNSAPWGIDSLMEAVQRGGAIAHAQ